MKNNKIKIGIIGCGNMGEAILFGGLKNNDFLFSICERRPKVIKRVKKLLASKIKRVDFLSLSKLVEVSDVIIIAVKPQDIEVVLEQIRQAKELLKKSPLIISIAAGIKTSYLERKLGKAVRVIRVMPNIAIKVKEGLMVFKKGRFSNNHDLRIATSIFAGLGRTLIIKKELLMDAITAISGSGPAYVAYIIEAILKVAEELRIDKDLAKQLIYQTFLGTLKLLQENDFNTKGLISQVASKKGTTEKALEFFKRYKLDKIIRKAIVSAFRRARQLSHK